MRKKTNLISIAGKKQRAERNNQPLGQELRLRSFSSGTTTALAKANGGARGHSDSQQHQQDLLHHEIKRGQEHLQQVQKDLDESRASLERWNHYELISSTHPLDHLIQTMALQEKTEQFLLDWLKRKQETLAKLR